MRATCVPCAAGSTAAADAAAILRAASSAAAVFSRMSFSVSARRASSASYLVFSSLSSYMMPSPASARAVRSPQSSFSTSRLAQFKAELDATLVKPEAYTALAAAIKKAKLGGAEFIGCEREAAKHGAAAAVRALCRQLVEYRLFVVVSLAVELGHIYGAVRLRRFRNISNSSPR